ncbi:hypothetical protein FM131_01700 [Weissella confusa]|uniref:hypothetical protein n=1 Tax=Weissella confusa TaxID=1583 RepID=UPI000989A3ED|nr:hypothetical protein [Weissella confusa]SJX67643.1 hypothetical protein FM131_01700 [Weissella confusa]
MFNAQLRKEAIEDYNRAYKRYEKVESKFGTDTNQLYDKRVRAKRLISEVEKKINMIANTPKTFDVQLTKIQTELTNFENKENEIKAATIEAKTAAGGAGSGATLSALGLAVATMGPTAAMGLATTVGVASTGTAISTLSGAAATNAALAWLSGGALAAGGGGMSAGGALLGLAGPVGWTIAGVAGIAALGSGIFASKKNKETAEKVMVERKKVERAIRKIKKIDAEVIALLETTGTQMIAVSSSNSLVTHLDYEKFDDEEKQNAGILVNATLTLAEMINKELAI